MKKKLMDIFLKKTDIQEVNLEATKFHEPKMIKTLVQKYAEAYSELEVDNNSVLYESRDGNSFVDSPYRFFLELVTNPEFANYSHFITVNEESVQHICDVVEMIPNKVTENIHFVERNSDEYIECLSTCKYLINNATFQNFFLKKADQIYINTWHGTPLKHMGFDIPGSPAGSYNVLRNFLMSDYLLSPNLHTADIFGKSYKLNGLYDGELLLSGYPRMDNTINPINDIEEKLEFFGLHLDGKKVALFSPTWSGSSILKPDNDIQQLISEFEYLKSRIGQTYQVFVKVHPFVYKFVKDIPELKGYLVSDYLDVNEFLPVVDILITDYSSIFFDFLIQDKPIFFYCPDYEQYIGSRGVYIPLKDLPGSVSPTIMELCECISNYDQSGLTGFERVRKDFVNKYCAYDDGHVTERLIKKIFLKDNSADISKYETQNGKKRLLVYPGGMNNNGITSSLVNLINNIDETQYDISVLLQIPSRNKAECYGNISKLPNHARLIFKGGALLYTEAELLNDKQFKADPLNDEFYQALDDTGYQREFMRVVGNSKFDVAIDFSGYSFYWGVYTAFSNAKTKLVFVHSDIVADSNREVNGKKIHYLNLNSMFRLYDKYSYILSVSKAVMEVNKNNLAYLVNDLNKFQYCINTINPERILSLGAGEEGQNEGEDCNEEPCYTIRKRNDYGFSIGKFLHCFAKLDNIPIQKFYKIEVFHQEIRVTSSVVMDEVEYYQVLVDNIRAGWVSSEEIEITFDPIVERESYVTLNRLTRPGNHVIWKYPYNTQDENYKITKAETLKGLYFNSTEKVTTSRSVYINVIFNGEVYGWVDVRSSQKILDKKSSANKKFYFTILSKKVNYQLRYKLNENTDSYEGSDFYVSIDPSHSKEIWKKPLGMFTNKNVTEVKSWTKDSVFHVKQTAIAGEKVSLNIFFEGKQIGWINKELTTPVELKNSDILKRSVMDSYIYIASKEPNPVKISLSDETLVPSAALVANNKTFHIDSKITTINGEFFHLTETEYFSEGFVRTDDCVMIEKNVLKDINGNLIEPISADHKNYVTMGRLSPEKNQVNLIKAFAQFVKNEPEARLYLLGDGILKNELLETIAELNVENEVFLLGQRSNPFSLMAQCDYFILPSLYEGQPMVLLEALTLKMKIIATDIPATRDVLNNGEYGVYIDGTEPADILKTLQEKEYEHKVQGDFDPFEYNRKAIADFYRFL
ncbi:hypothetical protein BAU18_000780 [Enterococcus diestrammenae]|uniref:Glycosyl transferase family 1 domain-containing protein n=1 Tax=Enterococcus diestrammenae TaxID=1155073 RepID=A0ABV0EZJ1_9ENTE